MDEAVYSRLKQDFGLKDKHILILRTLQQFPKLTAEELCKRTQIPAGRIYSYLNEMLNGQLIEKLGKRPCHYSLVDVKKGILSFIKYKKDNLRKSASDIIDRLQSQGAEVMEVIDNKDKYTFDHISMITEGRYVHIICIHGSFPWALYPEDWGKFFAMRTAISKKRPTISKADQEMAYLVFKAYKEAQAKSKQISVIFEKDVFTEHMNLIKEQLGAEFLEELLLSLLARIEQGNIKAHLTDEHQPMEVEVNNKKTLLTIRHKGLVNGMIIQSKGIVDLYDNYFHQKINRSTSLLPQILKELKILRQETAKNKHHDFFL